MRSFLWACSCVLVACGGGGSGNSNGSGAGGNASAGTNNAGGSAGAGAAGGAAGGSISDGGSTTGAQGGNSGSGGSGGTAPAPTKTFLYVAGGDYSGGNGMLRVYAVDTETGALTGPADTAVGDLNSFGAFSPSHDRLFIVDEAGSALRSYSVDAASGALTFGNEIATSGNPVHISVDQTGGFALVAYYNQDNVEVFPIDQDGSVGTAVDTEATGDQAHAIVLSPDNAFAFVPNKGANTVSQFLFDEETGALTANSTPTASVTGGPRHLTFGADGQAAYLITELDSAIAFMTYSEAEGTLSPSIFVSNLDPDFTGTPSGAEIQVTPDGAYVYGTNRAGAESTIGMYKVLEGGALEILGYESSHGEAPRNFAIHPNGDLLIVGNHDSNNLAVFRIGSDGLLEFVEAPDIGFPAYWVGFAEFPE